MTIALGFYCANGVVLATDRRGTEGNQVSAVEKIFRISPTGLVALSGNDYTWIREFLDVVRKEPRGVDVGTVRSATETYEQVVKGRFGDDPSRRVDFEGILATNDIRPLIFQFGFWKGFDFGEEAGRLSVGSAATDAEPFLRLAESFQMKMGYKPWRSLSVGLVARFCHALLDALPNYNNTVHGARIFMVSDSKENEGGIMEYPVDKIASDSFSVLLKHIQKEIPLQDVVKALSGFGLLNEGLYQVLSDYAKENEGFWESF